MKKNFLIISGSNIEDSINGGSLIIRNLINYIPEDFKIILLNNGLIKDKSVYKNIELYDFEKKSEKKWLRYIPIICYSYISLSKNKELIKKMKEILEKEKIDTIYYHGVSSYNECYTEIKGIKNVINLVDLYSIAYEKYEKSERNLLKKIFFLKEKILGRIVEKRMIKKFDKIILVNETEKNYANKLYFTEKFISIPVGIGINETKKLVIKNKEKIDLVFIGNMKFKPNRDGIKYFYETYFKKLSDNYILHVIGPNSERVLPDKNNIIIYGYVENLDKILCKMDFGIAMMINGGGQKTKILEYLSRGIPTIINEYVNDNNSINSKYVYTIKDFKEFLEILEMREKLILREKEIKEDIKRYYWENISNEFWNILRNKIGRAHV